MAEALLDIGDGQAKPHIVGKRVSGGRRWYVYAWRGGPLLFKRDGKRPTRQEAVFAAQSANRPKNSLPDRVIDPVKRGRGAVFHRPLFIKELIRLLAESERWTYFISDGKSVKIGAAACVRTRLRTLQTHNPNRLQVLAMVRGGEVLESAYHALFAEHRLRNEWFALAPEIADEIAYLEVLSRKRATPPCD